MRTTAKRKQELAKLHERLLAEKEQMLSQRRGELQVLIAPENAAIEDRIPILHEQHLVLSHHQSYRERMALIEAALERYAQGSYGICEECEAQIPLKRLAAVPWAAYCVTCQEQIDSETKPREHEMSLTA